MDQGEQQFLFLDMWPCCKNETWAIRNKFFQNGKLPKRLKWIKKQIILFGAGEHGIKVFKVFGKQVAYFTDNNSKIVGGSMEGIPVISFEQMKEIYNSYQLILSVGSRFLPEIIGQLEDSGITKYEFKYRRSNL